jgi:hypothetical protein
VSSYWEGLKHHKYDKSRDKFRCKLEQSTKKTKKVECPFDLKEMKEFFKCRADFEQAKKTLSSVQWCMSAIQTSINKCLDDINRVKTPWKPRDQSVAFAAQGADDKEEDQSDFIRWTWYADTAASTHMGNTDEGMFDYKEINEPITIGNGKDIWAKKRSKMRLTVPTERWNEQQHDITGLQVHTQIGLHAIRSIEIHRPRIQCEQ